MDKTQIPIALVVHPEPVVIYGNLDDLESYLRSGQAEQHWECILHEHHKRLIARCEGRRCVPGEGESVWDGKGLE